MSKKENANKFSNTLAKISKMPALSAGVLEDAASVIAKEGCIALNTHRVGIWTTTDEAKMLISLAYYDMKTDELAIQSDFILTSRQQYVSLLQTERLIVINDIRSPNALSDLVDEYGPNICSLLDAPIRVDGKLIGVVCIEQDRSDEYPEKRIWTVEEQNFASSLADFMALAIARNERLLLLSRNKTLMSNLPGMVYQCINNPPDFTFTYVSEGCFELTGYKPEELTGNSALKFFDMVHPDDSALLAKQNEETLSIGLPLDTTFRVITKDGKIKWIWERSSVVEFTPDGEAYVLEGFYADITERRLLEAAETASRFKSDFLAKMSHEIRTPMHAILGMVELALREDMSDAAREHTLTIKQAGANLLSIINDILDFSKIESGQLDIVTEKYMVSSLLNDVTNIIKMRALDSCLRFTVNVESSIPNMLEGDVVRIRQILLNILDNAVKYTEKGFVSVSVTGNIIDSDTVDLIIVVEDSGIGIDKENINNLFEDFSQFDLEANKGREGTGLGLAITNNLINAMGGSISVESEYGKGSTFTVTLPQKIIDNKALARIDEPDGKDVLIFERREICISSIIQTMNDLGVNYKIASTASEFFDGLISKKYAFAFVAASHYKNVAESFKEPESDTNIILIAEFGETVAHKGKRVLTTPIFSIPLANILNGVSDEYSHSVTDKNMVRFNAPDARVLIVDDINTNLKVSEGLLQPYQMRIDLCINGKTAIESAKSNQYDVIFMDHMMPDMDGIETTKHIRALGDDEKSRLYYRSVPIIALTANAVSGTKEMFLSNGFDDFLSKPIDTIKLDSILETWIPKDKQKKPIISTVSAKRENEESVTITGIDTKKGIEMTGRTVDGFFETLEIFFEDGCKRLKEIKISLNENDLRLFTIYVHALKSASASIGALDLSKAARSLEMAGERGDLNYIRSNTEEFLTDLEVLLTDIGSAISARKANRQSDSIDIEALKTNLSTLRVALDDFNTEAINEIAASLQAFSSDTNFGGIIGKILQHKLAGEYDEAILHIDTALSTASEGT